MKHALVVPVLAVAIALGISTAAFAGKHAYHVGDVVIYQNPNDGTPPRKARVTRVDADKMWLDFKEFQPELNVADASKILFFGTNQVDEWTRPAESKQNVSVGPVTHPAAESPARAEDVLGNWSTLQIGHTVTYAPGDGYIYQKQEIGAKAGVLSIRPDRTFVWNSKSQGVIKGRWRQATPEELRGGFGPAGIRLLHGENGWDYNVQRRPRQSNSVPDSIAIWTSGYQVNGYRVK